LNPLIVWAVIGFLAGVLFLHALRLLVRWRHQHRYGAPIAHEGLMVAYGRQMARLLNRYAMAQLLSAEVPRTLGVSRAAALLLEGHDLVAAGDAPVRLPVNHAAVRWVASGGEAVSVSGRLQELISQSRSDLKWTAVWVPLMRGSDLQGIWLLGDRDGGLRHSPEDLHWLTALARQAATVLETIRYAEQEQELASQMQALYRDAVSARETERERLSRELHDGVLQDLCAVTRDIKALETLSEDREQFAPLIVNASESVQTLRAICHDLRPPLLTNNLGLALRALVERLDAQSPSPIHIELSAGPLAMSEDAALAVYRIAQEALHNAIRHADASEIAVRLTQYPDRLRMTITDDGQGFEGGMDLRRFIEEGHFGLAGMRERAAMIGGELDVQSARDYGTVVILQVPN
jgi:signal transduction histidine kinase